MKKIYAVVNLILVVLLIAWNYLGNALGIGGNTVGSLSKEYYNLFTPADYAFSIWGLIFLGLLAHSLFQVKCAYDNKKEDDFIAKIGPWLLLANVANGTWLWFWLNERTGLTVFIMLIILASLLIIIIRLNMERWDAPLPVIAWIWWPISLYSGWITVATIANVAAYLAKTGGLAFFTETTWTLIMIAVATLINLLMVLVRNMREFALVGVWALVAIAVRHWNEIIAIQTTSLLCAALLVTVIGIQAYQNRDTNPLVRLIR